MNDPPKGVWVGFVGLKKLADRLLDRPAQRRVNLPQSGNVDRLSHERMVGHRVEEQRLPNGHLVVALGCEGDRGPQKTL